MRATRHGIRGGPAPETEDIAEDEEQDEVAVVDPEELSELQVRFLADTTTQVSSESTSIQEPGVQLGTESDADGLASLSSGAVVPLGRDEFVCQQCYLIRNRSQIADAARHICLDCAA